MRANYWMGAFSGHFLKSTLIMALNNTYCKEQCREAKCGWKEHGASWLHQSLQGPKPTCDRTWRKIAPICSFFCTLDKSKVDNGAEIVIKMIMKNSPVLNHPEVCGHNLVSQVLWLCYWIFDNITASIFIFNSFLSISRDPRWSLWQRHLPRRWAVSIDDNLII